MEKITYALSQGQSGKEQLNSNVLQKSVFLQHLTLVLGEIRDILLSHYGPYSKFALISNLDNVLAEPRFTKDGIGIIQSMQYDNKVDEYLRQIISYIGSRIESAIGDGTTSAMLFATEYLAALLKSPELCTIDYHTLTQAFSAMVKRFSKIEEEYEAISIKNICTEDTVDSKYHKQTVARFAFAQAYTSSHGDVELAKCVAELFVDIPEITWNYMTFNREGYETDKLIRLDYDDSQYSLDVDVLQPSMLTSDGGTTFNMDDGVLMLVPASIDTTSKISQEKFYAFLKKVVNEEDTICKGKKVLIIMPKFNDQANVMYIEQILNDAANDHPDAVRNIAIFQHYSVNPYANDFVHLCYVAGMNYKDVISRQELFYIDGVKAQFDHRKMRLYNLYAASEDTVVHPDAEKEGTPLYDYLKYLTMLMDQTKRAISSSPNAYKELEQFQKFYNKLYLCKHVSIVIGGPAYDNTAYLDIVKDTILATRLSLQKGVVRGGNLAMFAVFSEMNFHSEEQDWLSYLPENKRTGKPATDFVQACMTFVDLGCFAFEKILNDSQRAMAARQYVSQDLLSLQLTKIQSVLDPFVTEGDDLDKVFADGVPIVQPATTDVNILDRFAEVALKLCKTEHIVTPNYVHCVLDIN